MSKSFKIEGNTRIELSKTLRMHGKMIGKEVLGHGWRTRVIGDFPKVGVELLNFEDAGSV